MIVTSLRRIVRTSNVVPVKLLWHIDMSVTKGTRYILQQKLEILLLLILELFLTIQKLIKNKMNL